MAVWPRVCGVLADKGAVMLKAASGRKPLRVCVCVIFNHPFPKIVPIIREIYKDRFDKVLFFMPFERMPDEDVITVYHGCYASPAYITESRHILEQVDCDVFMFVHDDVILNPKLNERNFVDYFPLGPEDGFIPVAESPPEAMGDWIWYFGSVPRMFFPKSILFSGGIEFENVYKYLPDPKALIAKLEGLGVHHKTFVRIDYTNLPDVENKPSRALFHGITRSRADGSAVRIQDGTDLQEDAERLSLEAVRAFTKAMNATLRADDPSQMRGDYIDLPYPLISTGYLSDFYILPKGKLAEFAHYAGVFTAANIWHETMVATIMFAICDKVFRAQDLGLDFAGFTDRPGLEAFHDPDYMAIHPIKLSPYATPEAAESFLALLRAIGEAATTRPARRARAGSVSDGRRRKIMPGRAGGIPKAGAAGPRERTSSCTSTCPTISSSANSRSSFTPPCTRMSPRSAAR